MRRSLIAGCLVAAVASAGASAAPPASPFDDALWTRGKGGFNMKMACIYTCQLYTVMMNNVYVRGPEAAPTTRPKVGERFYVRTELALLSGPFAMTDSYRTKVILPEGVTPSITAPDDVICAVTWTNDVTVRVPGPAECQDPVQSGVEWVFPPVWLDESTDAQVSQFWFPVVANRPIAGEIIQITGTAVANPLTLLPNPIVAEVPLYVDPAPSAPVAPPSATGGTASGAAGGAAGGTPTTTPVGSVAARTSPGAVAVSWAAPAAPGLTGYRVQVRRRGTTKWITVGTTTRTARTFRWKKARRGTTYFVRVAPIVNGTTGAWSKPVRVTAR